MGGAKEPQSAARAVLGALGLSESRAAPPGFRRHRMISNDPNVRADQSQSIYLVIMYRGGGGRDRKSKNARECTRMI
ncbi:hypothetical protein L209DRAFT_758666 [Thermothelomyces heterothallicus CBS 203.75]